MPRKKVPKDPPLGRGIHAVREPLDPRDQRAPEDGAIGRRGRVGDAAEAGNVLMPDLSGLAAGLDERYLEPAGGFAEPDKQTGGVGPLHNQREELTASAGF